MKNKFLLVLTLIFSMILPSCVFVSFSSMATQEEETYILDETGTRRKIQCGYAPKGRQVRTCGTDVFN